MEREEHTDCGSHHMMVKVLSSSGYSILYGFVVVVDIVVRGVGKLWW